ncbi:hypothetical protein ACFL04_00280 [Patescibacteria group bacterium]
MFIGFIMFVVGGGIACALWFSGTTLDWVPLLPLGILLVVSAISCIIGLGIMVKNFSQWRESRSPNK